MVPAMVQDEQYLMEELVVKDKITITIFEEIPPLYGNVVCQRVLLRHPDPPASAIYALRDGRIIVGTVGT